MFNPLTATAEEIAAEAAKANPALVARLERQARRLTANANRARGKRAETADRRRLILEAGEGIIICLLCEGQEPDTNASFGPIARPRHPETERRDALFDGRYVPERKALRGIKRFGGDNIDLSKVRPYRFLATDRSFNCGGLDMSASRLGTEYAAPFIRAKRFLRDPEAIDANAPGDQFDRAYLPARRADTREMDWGNSHDDDTDPRPYRGPALDLVPAKTKAPYPYYIPGGARVE
jgi:hypothetical protein